MRDPLGVAVDLRIGEVLQKLTRSAGVIEVNVGEKDVVDVRMPSSSNRSTRYGMVEAGPGSTRSVTPSIL